MNKIMRLIAISLAAVTALSIPVLSLAVSQTEAYDPFPGTRYRITSSVWVPSTSTAKGTITVTRVRGPLVDYIGVRMVVGAFDAAWRPINTVARSCGDDYVDTYTGSLSCPTLHSRKVGHAQGTFQFMDFNKMMTDVG